MTNRSSTSALVPAVQAYAQELPHGKRRRELESLARMLLQDSSVATHSTSGWMPVFARGLTTSSTAFRLSEFMQKASRESEMRSRRRRLFLYPVAILALAVIVFFFLGQFVVAPFRQMYDEFGLMLPLPTRVLFFWVEQWQMHTVRFVTLVMIFVAAAVFGIRYWMRHAMTTRYFSFFAGGHTSSVAAMASFTGLLSDLLSSDVPLAEALSLAGRGCGNAYYQSTAQRLGERLAHGDVLLRETSESKSFPANVIEALQPTQGGPPNTSLLDALSTIYSERATRRTDWAGAMVGAFALLFVGIIVAFVVLSLFMPMVSLISGLS